MLHNCCYPPPPPHLPTCSGGVERSVLLWQPKGNVNKPVGELPGHASGVAHLLVADEQSQVGRPGRGGGRKKVGQLSLPILHAQRAACTGELRPHS